MNKTSQITFKKGSNTDGFDGLLKGEVALCSMDDINLVIGCPRCGLVIWLKNHQYHISQSNVITILPSIGHNQCKAHFFIRENHIEWCKDI